MSAEQITESLEQMNLEQAPEKPVAAAEGEGASASLYVGELNFGVSEALLFEIFSPLGPVALIRVCRDAVTKKLLGYAYVNFHKHEDGEKAIEELNYSLIDGRPCRIMWLQRDPLVRRSGDANVYIKNLHPDIDHKALHDTFSAFGTILLCKVATDQFGALKCFGFVHYETAEAAQAAIENVNGMTLNGREVFVGKHLSKRERESMFEGLKAQFTNVFVKNFGPDFTEAELRALFEPCGQITSVHFDVDAEGKSKGFAFVNFERHESAAEAVAQLNDREVKGQKIYVGRAQKKRERTQELKKQFETMRLENLSKYQGANLFVKNLDADITSELLEQEFRPFGTITSAKVMLDDAGKSKGFGFVCFSAPEEATKAIAEMHQRMVYGKPLYVALAQRKDVRRSQMEQQYLARNQMRMQSAASGMPGQYMQPPMIYQNPAFFNGRNQPFPPNPQMMMPRGQMPPPQGQWPRAGPNGQPVPMYGMPPMYGDFNGPRGPRPYYPRKPRRDLAAIIQAAPADQQKRILGEELYPKIVATGKAQEPEAAGKITGMMLDLDNSEILALLDDDELFSNHFEDALTAYEEYKKSEE